MTKKTVITYSMLFLFAFTFALAFAMEARAEGGQCGNGCCTLYCDGYPELIATVGHLDVFMYCTGIDTCYGCYHETFVCPPIP